MWVFEMVDRAQCSEESFDVGRGNGWVGVPARLVAVLSVLAALLGVGRIPMVHADILTVCGSSCDYTTIAAAVQAANAGDTISVLEAIHTESGIVVDEDVTIVGSNVAGTVVQGATDVISATDRVFEILPGAQVVIRTMVIRHGKATGNPARGGGIWNGGTLSLEQVTVEANQAVGSPAAPGGVAQGGGIYTEGDLQAVGCTISGNLALGGEGASCGDDGGDGSAGGLFHGGGNVVMFNSTVSGNMARSGDSGGG